MSTTFSTPKTPITGPPGCKPLTKIIKYPNPYRPSYDTVASLWDDSSFIFMAVVEPLDTALGGYELNVLQWFGQEDRGGGGVGITTQEFNAAHLRVGGTYVFFYAIDPGDRSTCIVGGTRGVFSYNATAQTLTRIGASAASRVPSVQTLTQFESTLNALLDAEQNVIHNLPPMCRASATGLPS